MKAWQFKSAAGGLEKNLYLSAGGVQKPKPKDNEVLVEVYSMALNPADYKVPELGLIAKTMVPSPSIPGMDFCGRIVEVGSKVENLHVDEMVFGAMQPGNLGRGSLGQFIAVSKDMCAVMPVGMLANDFAAIGCAGATAYQSIQPKVKEGDKIFINGGSGGTGTWGIQIAKALGCHVTTSCSTANVELCRSLGADEVLDYKTVDIVEELEGKGQVFSLVIDNVGSPSNLYKVSHKFLLPNGRFVQVGVGMSFGSFPQLVSNMIRPGFLGGGKRKYEMLMVKPKAEEFERMATWMKEGKIKAVIDTVFEFDDAPKAFEKLKTGRAKGKIIVHTQVDR
ncbi:NAD(P)-binding protein [Lindgomyces ingoldianus]|uniref:NAD(P)-binding protein n=1 Tax=Lindgomyces ingoldianus TaxID=673940 RepID=A0ACB6Q850_9PLEO|nr:NAD(P)-binding protein [Lindgomyces ingoldianus]KAF2463084.1 NAD(P)-binding protein [Lindgomyces ingoldianus]